MRKRIFLSILLGVNIALTIVTIIFTVNFIIRQSNIETAYFYESFAEDGRKFASVKEYSDYANSGGKLIYSTAKSITIAVLILLVELCNISLSVYFLLLIYNALNFIKISLQETAEIRANKKERQRQYKIDKLEKLLEKEKNKN